MNQKKLPCKIYSRSRFKIFKSRSNKVAKSKYGLKLFYIEVMSVAIFTFIVVYKSIDPLFETACSDKAKSIATKITNDDSTKIIQKYNYGDLFEVQKDEKRKYTNGKSEYSYNRSVNF